MKKSIRNQPQNVSAGGVIARSVLTSVGAELLLIALFAYLLYQGVFGIELVNTLSAVIKALGAVCAAVICAACTKSKRIILCPTAAVVYTLVCYVLLSVFSGGFSVSIGLLWDVLISAGTGVCTAIIANLKK